MNRLKIFITLVLLFIQKLWAQGFYYEEISTPDKSIDLLFGFYSGNMERMERKDGSIYTVAQIGLINRGKEDFKWNDYKVYVLLKNGDLFYNYKTEAKDENSDYACIFNLKSGATVKKWVCFEKKFSEKDIDKVWLSLNDYKFFKLLYSDK